LGACCAATIPSSCRPSNNLLYLLSIYTFLLYAPASGQGRARSVYGLRALDFCEVAHVGTVKEFTLGGPSHSGHMRRSVHTGARRSRREPPAWCEPAAHTTGWRPLAVGLPEAGIRSVGRRPTLRMEISSQGPVAAGCCSARSTKVRSRSVAMSTD